MSRFPTSPYGRYYDPLIQQYMLQDYLARKENEERYLDLVSGRQGTRERIMGDLADYGQSRIDDINRRADINNRNDTSYLTSRGLGASNIVAGTRRMNDEERERELRREQDAIINRRVGTDERLSDSLHSFIERRNDVQPDPNQLARLSQGLGQAGVGYGQSSNLRPIQNQQPYLGMDPYANPSLMLRGGNRDRRYTPGMFNSPQGNRPTASAYSAPGLTAGGYDNQFGNALGRYDNRMAMTGGYGMYGQQPSGIPRLGFAGRPGATAYGSGVPQQPAQTYANSPARMREEQLYQSQFGTHSPKQQFSNFKSNPIARQYSGFGSNMWNEQPAQLAPEMGNIGYGNPVQQLNQLQAGALASAGRYPTIPGGYPLGQPSVRPAPTNQSLAPVMNQAGGMAWLPYGPINPFAMLK